VHIQVRDSRLEVDSGFGESRGRKLSKLGGRAYVSVLHPYVTDSADVHVDSHSARYGYIVDCT
jgi:hypothetical protein